MSGAIPMMGDPEIARLMALGGTRATWAGPEEPEWRRLARNRAAAEGRLKKIAALPRTRRNVLELDSALFHALAAHRMLVRALDAAGIP